LPEALRPRVSVAPSGLLYSCVRSRGSLRSPLAIVGRPFGASSHSLALLGRPRLVIVGRAMGQVGVPEGRGRVAGDERSESLGPRTEGKDPLRGDALL
jgi:hypothetical protein